MNPRRRAGLAAVGLALAIVVTGSGGLAAESLAAFQLASLVAAGLAASLPAHRGARGAAAAGLALVAVTGLSAARAPYVFASLDRWAAWCAALLLGWALSRLERAAPEAETGRRETGVALLAAAAAVLLLQGLSELGLPVHGSVQLLGGSRRLGSFASPNHLSEMLVVLAVALLPWAGLRGRLPRAAAALAVGSAGLSLLTGSRSAPIAVLAVLAALGLARLSLRGRHARRLAIGLVLAGAVVALAGVSAVSKRFTEADAWTRPRIWAAVAPAARERPVLGLGPGSFRHVHHRYQFPVESRVGRYAKRPSTPHGEWLRLPIEIGVVGCALLALLVAACWRAPAPGRRFAAAGPWLAVVVSFGAVHELFHAPALPAWLAVALVAATRPKGRGEEPGEALLGRAAPERSAVLVLLGLSAFIGLVWRPTLADRAMRRGDLGRALALNPRQAGYWLEAGRAAASGGSADPRALAAAALADEEASRLSLGSPDGPRALGRVLARATTSLLPEPASREAAAAAWAEASRRSPYDPFLLVERAVFLLGTGAPGRAGELAARALALEPNYVDAALVAHLAARAAGGEQAAEQERRRALRVLETADSLGERAGSDYERRLITADPRLLRDSALGTGQAAGED